MLSTYSLTVMMLLAKQFLLPPCSPAAAGWVGTPETRPGWPARVRGACELSRWWGARKLHNNRLSWRRGSVPARLARWASSSSLAFTAGCASLLARRGRRRRASGTSERGRRRHAPAGRGGRLSWRRRISRVRSARPPSSGEFVNAKSLLAARRGLRCRGRREGEPVAALAPPARVCGPSSACWVARGSPQLAQCVAAPGAVDSLIQGSVSAVLSVRERRVAPPGGLRADTSLAARWCDGGGAAGRQQRANHGQQQMQQPAVCLPSQRRAEISRGGQKRTAFSAACNRQQRGWRRHKLVGRCCRAAPCSPIASSSRWPPGAVTCHHPHRPRSWHPSPLSAWPAPLPPVPRATVVAYPRSVERAHACALGQHPTIDPAT